LLIVSVMLACHRSFCFAAARYEPGRPERLQRKERNRDLAQNQAKLRACNFLRQTDSYLANGRADRGTQHQEEVIMKMSVKAMMLSAAIPGLPGGTSSTLNASPTHAAGSKVFASGLNRLGRASFAVDKDKHSCKGKNDCKGEGGCKSSDN